jgi:hypothetical protein
MRTLIVALVATAENASGFYLRKGVVDGIERALGYRRVGDYPLRDHRP